MKKHLPFPVAAVATLSCQGPAQEPPVPAAPDNSLGALVFRVDPAAGVFEQVAFDTSVRGVQLDAENDGNPGTGNADAIEAVTGAVGIEGAGPCAGTDVFGGTVTLNSFYSGHTISNLAVRIEQMSPVAMTENNSAAAGAGGLADKMYGIWTYAGGAGTAETWCFDIDAQQPLWFRVNVYGDLTAIPSYKRVFVTSTTHDADMNDEGSTGISGGDAICQARAAGASIGGTWVAWLSDDGTDAGDRVTDAE